MFECDKNVLYIYTPLLLFMKEDTVYVHHLFRQFSPTMFLACVCGGVTPSYYNQIRNGNC